MIELNLDWKNRLGYVVCDSQCEGNLLTAKTGVGYGSDLVEALSKYIGCTEIENSDYVCLTGSDFKWLINELAAVK